MRRLLIVLMVCAAALAAPLAEGAAPRWENMERAQWSERLDADGLDVAVADGVVYLTLASRSHVKVFTILGQLISQETLAPGTHRMRLGARGIYIIKVGEATRRVTI